MEHLYLGICDDEPQDLELILGAVKQYDRENQFRIATFLHARDLLECSDDVDILIMDIEMEPPNGFEVAKKLADQPNAPVIIFVTKSNAYAMKGYGIAIRYLQKPIVQADFIEAMDAAVADATAHRLTFQVDSATVSIMLRDVQYIEAFGHYVVVHTNHNAYRFRSTLKDVLSRLPKGYFVAPHKSYIVNLEHIHSATAAEITLDCGAAVPIGRKRAQDFNEALYRFLGR